MATLPPRSLLSAPYQGRPRRLASIPVIRDGNAANVTAGLTALVFYLFGAVPVFLGITATMHLSAREISSWYFIAFLTSGIATMVLSLRYRQPLAIGFSLPGLVLLSTAGARYSLAELMGACLLAGVCIVVLAATGAIDWLMRQLPLPIVLGMFVGSTLHFVTDIFVQLDADPRVIGAALAGYLAATACKRVWLPPVAGAVVGGVGAALLTGQTHAESLQWGAPHIAPLLPAFDPGALVALTLPLVLLVIGSGNVQGLGVLAGQGYVPPVSATTLTVGVASIVNSLFGGNSSTIQSVGTGILAGEDAGPPERRYVATTIAGAGCIFLAGGATIAGALLGVLPVGLVATLAGLAVLKTLLATLQQAVASELRTGAFVALAIAASPLTLFGIGPAFWALVGGYVASAVVEHSALRASERCLPCSAQAAGR